MGSSTSRAIRRRRPATRTGWRPKCAFQAIDSLPSVQPKTNTSVFGEAERQGHESELDEPTTVGAALEPREEGRAGSPPALRRVITLRHAVAIYVSSLLGSGIFVVPGLAARIAGPASIVSWVLLSLASYPFAYTFAKLSARRPESGGIYAFARDGIGLRAGAATAWLFLAWAVLGAPAATVAAASYLVFVFPLTRFDIFLVAAGILIAAFAVNYIGIRFTGRVQVATVAAILVALAIAVVASAPRIAPANYAPFLPNGVTSIGTAAALIVWSYLGYENTSNVAEEFRDPERDFHRSVVISVILISGLYLAVAFVTVGTGAYLVGGGVTPFAAMMSDAFGTYGGAIVTPGCLRHLRNRERVRRGDGEGLLRRGTGRRLPEDARRRRSPDGCAPSLTRLSDCVGAS